MVIDNKYLKKYFNNCKINKNKLFSTIFFQLKKYSSKKKILIRLYFILKGTAGSNTEAGIYFESISNKDINNS